MTQIESAALAWISLAIAGNAIFAIALSSTDSAIPTARFRIAQYLSGSGSPSSAVFIMRLTYAAAPARARPDNAATASAHGQTGGEGGGRAHRSRARHGARRSSMSTRRERRLAALGTPSRKGWRGATTRSAQSSSPPLRRERRSQLPPTPSAACAGELGGWCIWASGTRRWEARFMRTHIGLVWIVAFVASLAAANAQTPPPSTAGAAFDGTYRLVSSATVNQTFMTRKAQVGQCPDRRPGPLTIVQGRAR